MPNIDYNPPEKLELNLDLDLSGVTGEEKELSLSEFFEVELKKVDDGIGKEKQNLKEQTDPCFWNCIIFQTKEQAKEFNRIMGFDPDVPYIDGLELCEKLGVELQSITPAMPKYRKTKSFNNLME